MKRAAHLLAQNAVKLAARLLAFAPQMAHIPVLLSSCCFIPGFPALNETRSPSAGAERG
jgi:hypothetical protein